MKPSIILAFNIAATALRLNAQTIEVSFYAYDQAAQNTPYYSHFSLTSDDGVPGWYGSGTIFTEGIVNLYDSGWGFSETGNSSHHVMTRIGTSDNAPRTLRSVGWHLYSFVYDTQSKLMDISMDGAVIQSGMYQQPINWFMFNFNGNSQESIMDDFVVRYNGDVVYEQSFDSTTLDPSWIITREDVGGYIASGDTSNPYTGLGALALGGKPTGVAFDLRTVPEPTTSTLAVFGVLFAMTRRCRQA